LPDHKEFQSTQRHLVQVLLGIDENRLSIWFWHKSVLVCVRANWPDITHGPTSIIPYFLIFVFCHILNVFSNTLIREANRFHLHSLSYESFHLNQVKYSHNKKSSATSSPEGKCEPRSSPHFDVLITSTTQSDPAFHNLIPLYATSRNSI
jgi:hypothetical protein